MPKEVIAIDLQRPSTNIPWGFVICGGRDQVSEKLNKNFFHHSCFILSQGLTLKVGNVKRMTPASRAGLCKMDYLISVNIFKEFLFVLFSLSR